MKKRLVLIIIAISVAISSAWGLTIWASQQQEMEQVLVVARDIPAYTVLKSEDLTWRNVPVGRREVGTVKDIREAVNKIALQPLYRYEQIRIERLGSSPLVLNPNERAISIPIDPITSVGMDIEPGDKVDVYWVRSPDISTILIAENAVILSIGNKTTQDVFNVQALNKEQNSLNITVIKVKHAEVPGVARALSDGMIVLAKARKGGE
jgi:Flp pilus assembly protein CpaB